MAVSKISFEAPFYIRNVPIKNDLDFDTVTQAGFYRHTYDAGQTPTYTNAPNGISNVFVMMVLEKESGPVQLVIDNNSQMFFRVKWSAEWKTWNKVTTTTA